MIDQLNCDAVSEAGPVAKKHAVAEDEKGRRSREAGKCEASRRERHGNERERRCRYPAVGQWGGHRADREAEDSHGKDGANFGTRRRQLHLQRFKKHAPGVK